MCFTTFDKTSFGDQLKKRKYRFFQPFLWDVES